MNRIYILAALLIILSSCEEKSNDNSSVLKFYGNALEDIGYSVSQTDNGYYIAGQFTEVSRGGSGNLIESDKSVKKMAIIKTDIFGNTVWKKSFGNGTASVGIKVLALTDGSAVCIGYTVDPVTLQKDIYVVKVSSDGETAIEKTFNSVGTSISGNSADGNQSGIDIVQSGDGFMLLASTDIERLQGANGSGNIAGNNDIYLLKLSNNLVPAGVPEVIGFPGNDAGVAIKKAINSGFIIVGTTDRSEQGKALNNILIVKANDSGVATQIRILATTEEKYASDIEVLSDGYFIAGNVGKEGSDQSIYITKVPENIFGQQLFEKTYKVISASSSATSFSVKAINPYRSKSFVMAGQAGIGTSAKMLIFITDFEGNQVEGKEMITVADGIQVAYDVITDESDNIIAVGKNSFENNSMISLLKFRF